MDDDLARKICDMSEKRMEQLMEISEKSISAVGKMHARLDMLARDIREMHDDLARIGREPSEALAGLIGRWEGHEKRFAAVADSIRRLEKRDEWNRKLVYAIIGLQPVLAGFAWILLKLAGK